MMSLNQTSSQPSAPRPAPVFAQADPNANKISDLFFDNEQLQTFWNNLATNGNNEEEEERDKQKSIVKEKNK
jgi:hypothetical protein